MVKLCFENHAVFTLAFNNALESFINTDVNVIYFLFN